MNQPLDPRSPEAIAQRLIALRNLYGAPTQRWFADYLGIGYTTWNNYETAKSQPDHPRARIIVDKTGVTMDWIYGGNVAGLPTSLSIKLEAELAKGRPSSPAAAPSSKPA